jgi:hypothetical protein
LQPADRLPQRHERGEQVDSNADQGTPTLLGKERRRRVLGERHLLRVLREYEIHDNVHRPHRSLGQAAPLKPLPGAAVDLDGFRARLRDLISGVIHEYAQAA